MSPISASVIVAPVESIFDVAVTVTVPAPSPAFEESTTRIPGISPYPRIENDGLKSTLAVPSTFANAVKIGPKPVVLYSTLDSLHPTLQDQNQESGFPHKLLMKRGSQLMVH